ncbi:MAG TPA: HNH endonuclease, partial [Vicinamibacteria bacterium]|nr:HNH endonuclease [Vicinamibacteria bacterium]
MAHLAELDTRPALYAAEGHGSRFTYCTNVLRLSEDATCNRIQAARACRRFPVLLDRLASGALSLTTVRMLGPCVTPENHQAVLERASGRSRR